MIGVDDDDDVDSRGLFRWFGEQKRKRKEKTEKENPLITFISIWNSGF